MQTLRAMVRNDNAQRYKYGNNSLLRSATSKRLGAARFGSLLGRGINKAPIKKVKIQRSDDSRISDLTASIVDDIRPAMIKEVRAPDVESDIMEMSLASGNSIDFSVSKVFDKDVPLVGEAMETKPQPVAFPNQDFLPPAAAKKKAMEIQPGLRITSPSPMSLDRIQVQVGQEKVAPPSQEYILGLVEKKKAMEIEEKKKEYMDKKADEKNELKKMLKEELKLELRKEHEEGFEAQLEEFEQFEPQSKSPKKRSLMKKILNKLRPQKNTPLTAEEARVMARQAMARSKLQKNVGQEGLPIAPSNLPIDEITTKKKEESVSDLESSAQKQFPVKEVQARDDNESISTLGTQHVLEKLLSGPLRNHVQPGRELRDPTPTSELERMTQQKLILQREQDDGVPRKTTALIDNIDSGTLTEDAEANINFSRCTQMGGRKKNSRTKNAPVSCAPGALNFALAAFCIQPPIDDEDQLDAENKENKAGSDPEGALLGAVAAKAAGIVGEMSKGECQQQEANRYPSVSLRKALSPINEDNCLTPNSEKSLPALEGEGQVINRESNGVIDLTNLASPASPTTEDGVKENRTANNRKSVFSFDDFMDMAVAKLQQKNGDDRYAVEGDDSPRKAMKHGIPVVQGKTVRKSRGSLNEVTPKASGGQRRKAGRIDQEDDNATRTSAQSSFEVYEHPEGDVVMWSVGSGPEELVESPIASPTQSPKYSRGNSLVDSPIGSPAPPQSPLGQTSKTNGFADYFSDGLFDLLSTDESVTRGRKKVPFLSNNSTPNMQRGDEVAGKLTTQEGMDPSLGLMCGAVPLYFMYKGKEESTPARQHVQKAAGMTARAHNTIDAMTRSMNTDAFDAIVEQVRAAEGPLREQGKLNAHDWTKEAQNSSLTGPKQGDGHPAMEGRKAAEDALQNQREVDAVAVDKDGILLEQDDAYWDTLSTIASTKGKSIDSVKKYEGQELLAGPIPVEITMKNKQGGAEATPQHVVPPVNQLETQKVSDDKPSNGSFSQNIAAGDVPREPEAVASARAGSASVGNSIEEPPSCASIEASDGEKVVDTRVAGFVSRFENVLGKNNPATDGSTSSTSEDTGLLLTVTRSEGDDKSLSQRNAAALFEQGKNAWQGLEPYLSMTPGMATLNNILTESSKAPTSSRDKPAPSTGIMSTPTSSSHAIFTSWKNSNRSVSWGFEEIYEAPEQLESPTSTESERKKAPFDQEATQGRDLAAALSPATAAATAAAAAMRKSPEVASATDEVEKVPIATAGAESKPISDEDEQELISRTLQLSKKLLATMTAQDLEGADNEVVKTLLSFGTEDSAARSSLPEISASLHETGAAVVESRNNTLGNKEISIKEASTMEASSMENTAVPAEPSINKVEETDEDVEPIPAAVNVDTTKTPAIKPLPTPSSVRKLDNIKPIEKSKTAVALPVIDITPADFPTEPVVIDAELESVKAQERKHKHETVDAGVATDSGYSRSAPSESQSASGTSEHSPIDVEGMLDEYENLARKLLDENVELKSMAQTQGSAPSDRSAQPPTPNRFDQLRAQRAAALKKFNGIHSSFEKVRPDSVVLVEDPSALESRVPTEPSTAAAVSSPMSATTAGTLVTKRGRDRLANYGRTQRAAEGSSLVDAADARAAYMDHLENSSTTSSMKSTASMKARELRKQLDEALKASKDIRKSQEQLGSELREFKNRFYKKNDALEDQAMKAIGGLKESS